MISTDGGTELRIEEHIVLKNFWEYYIVWERENERDPDPNIRLALVMGFETELGLVDLEEIKPYIITRTKNLSNLFPATGYKWAK